LCHKISDKTDTERKVRNTVATTHSPHSNTFFGFFYPVQISSGPLPSENHSVGSLALAKREARVQIRLQELCLLDDGQQLGVNGLLVLLALWAKLLLLGVLSEESWTMFSSHKTLVKLRPQQSLTSDVQIRMKSHLVRRGTIGYGEQRHTC
jgi:hypothetical protein